MKLWPATDKTERQAPWITILIIALLALSAMILPAASRAEPAPTSSPAPATVPGGFERWMGSVEGSKGAPSGAAILYDFRFRSDGTVTVERSYNTAAVSQSFRYEKRGGQLALSGDPNGPLKELSSVSIRQVDGRHLSVPLRPGVEMKVMPSIGWASWLHWIFFAAIVIFLGNELARHSKWAAFTLFFIFPVALLPLWLHSGFDTFFRWEKLYSAIAGAALFTAFRFTRLERAKWVRPAIAAVLAINIMEACIQDFHTGELANRLNMVAGLLNIITIWHWAGIKRDEQRPHDMLWPGMTISWIIAYDFWNITFVYLNWPSTAYLTLVILLVPTLAAMFIKKGTWMQARAYTLAIYLMYMFSFNRLIEDRIGLDLTIPFARNDAIVWTLVTLSLGSNLIYAALFYRWRLTGKAPARLQVGQNKNVIEEPPANPPPTLAAA